MRFAVVGITGIRPPRAVSLQPEQNLCVLVGHLCPDGLIFLSETHRAVFVDGVQVALCLLSVDRIAQPNVVRVSRGEESGLEGERF